MKNKQLQLIKELKSFNLDEVKLIRSTSSNIQDSIVTFLKRWDSIQRNDLSIWSRFPSHYYLISYANVISRRPLHPKRPIGHIEPNKKHQYRPNTEHPSHPKRYRHEQIGPSKDIRRRQDERLISVDHPSVVVINDADVVATGLEVFIYAAEEFAAGGEAGGAHPHDEVLVGGVQPLDAGAIGGTLVFAWVVIEEGDWRFVYGDAGAVLGEELVGVVEERVGWVGAGKYQLGRRD